MKEKTDREPREPREVRSSREMSLSTFPQAWAEILEGALKSPFEVEFPDKPTAKKFQSQFYNLRRAMARERPDLWQKYLDLSFFLRPVENSEGSSSKVKVIIRIGHPLEETLKTLGIKGCPWPDPPSGRTVEKLQESPKATDSMEDVINRLFKPERKEGELP